ncbi:unnamed protein product [Oppiella nova]|uniref:acetylcholinesterase n=1 Tax=Oppiella nova TaxID=334625 RepID=A0A7R9QSU7_9ACAR|nr:unnamed protein product [Oppiella nova]CAG2174446.1 unnamed protein product [Oppiella nova]
MIKAFTTFAWEGKPADQSGAEWRQYYGLNDRFHLIVSILSLQLCSQLIRSESDDTQLQLYPIAVTLKSGSINGKRIQFNGKELSVFLGIPYAEPPVEGLRFQKPLPVRHIPDPYDAIQWPKACVHQKLHQNYLNQEMSEDCLYLNIWSPNTTGALKPVMFWIHGGGMKWGSSVEKWYSGHVLAAMGDVVVVTFNYRLNVFGLLYTGAKHTGAPGNMALWDQALALEWVVDNIAYFGGDPNSITMFGESAGSISTSFHILSPITKNLFRRVIMMSGSATNNVCKPEALEIVWYNRAVSMGCGNNNENSGQFSIDDEDIHENLTEFTPEMIECIQKAPVVRLQNALDLRPSACDLDFLIDGQFVLKNPIETLASGDYRQDLDLLIGTVDNEGSMFMALFVDPVAFDKWKPHPISYDQAYNYEIGFITAYQAMRSSDTSLDTKLIADLYFNGLSNNTGADILLQTIGRTFGDYLLACPTKLFARGIHKGSETSRVFEYYFNAKFTAGAQLFCSDWMGVCHFDDIYPVFGLPFQEYDRYGPKEREISGAMIKAFTTFAWEGKPADQSGAEWRQYYGLNDRVIAPYYEFTTEPKLKTNFGLNVKSIECEYLWYKYLETF